MSGRSGSVVAAHTPLAVVAGVDGATLLSVAGARILRRAIAEGGSIYVRGAEVAACRSLVSRRLGALTDDGNCRQDGKVDGERWTFKVNPTVTVSGGG